MAVQADEFDDNDGELEEMDAKGLRGLLQRSERERRKLQDQVVAHEADRLIRDKGLDLVKPEDLKGVKPEELEAKAQALQDDRLRTAREVVRSRFERQGLAGDDLESALDDFFGGQAPQSQSEIDTETSAALGRARRLPVGAPAPRIDTEKLQGMDAIEAALAAGEQRRASKR